MNRKKAPQPPRILITRPLGQHINLEQQCRALGCEVSLLPCIVIEHIDVSCAHIEQTRRLHDIVLFTSTNSVRSAHSIAPLPWPDIQVHAIGAATASLLSSLGQTLSLAPQAPYSSEAYLSQIVASDKRRLLIIKGVGGRELIADHLTSLGWTVSGIDIYRRSTTRFDAGVINELFTERKPDIIFIGSDEILTNLWRLCHAHHETLRRIVLIVNSLRCATLAQELGFYYPALIAQPAGDAGQIACLQNWMTRCDR